MGFRPEFEDTVKRSGNTLTLVGRSDPDPLPVAIQAYLEQGGRVAGGPVDQVGASWRADLPADGFTPGPALAFGIETRTKPFEASSWTETVTIE